MEKVFGSKTSVYVGCFTREYEQLLARDPEANLKYIATGTGTAMLSNRLSWFYDLRGPSITLDTACSSSLNACHLACASLRSGEANMVGRPIGLNRTACVLISKGPGWRLQSFLQSRNDHSSDKSGISFP